MGNTMFRQKSYNYCAVVCYLTTLFTLLIAVNPDTQYSAAEKDALKQFKVAVANITYEKYHKLDSYLIHFLRHKRLNVTEATLLLKENFKWRKSERIDSILQEKRMKELEKQLPISAEGADKEGRPILSSILGKIDLRKFTLTGKTDEFFRYNIYASEKALKKVYSQALAGKDVSQYIALTDLYGFNLRQHACLPCIPDLTAFVRLVTDRYPNTVYQIIYVNAPKSFTTFFSIIREILPPEVLQLIHVYGFDKTEWRPYLSKLIENDQLATVFGGTRPS